MYYNYFLTILIIVLHFIRNTTKYIELKNCNSTTTGNNVRSVVPCLLLCRRGINFDGTSIVYVNVMRVIFCPTLSVHILYVNTGLPITEPECGRLVSLSVFFLFTCRQIYYFPNCFFVRKIF